ncbi:YrhC family protein [Bacillus mycoides]|uniref:YrhC family protein n=1 Tax=Bacillus mycoides TaxID=1405 RepID=UPI003F752076
MKELQEKIADYTRFAQVLLAISTFLMIGLLIPSGIKSMIQSFVMMGSIIVFLVLAFFFFKRVRTMRDQLEESEYEENC